MKYFGTITGLPGAAATPAAIPGALPPVEEGRQKTDYRALALLCVAGTVIGAIIVYAVGRKRRR